MKISKREKILLYILGALLIAVGYYKFIFSSGLEKINNLKKEKDSISIKYNIAKGQSAAIKDKENSLKILNAKIQSKTQNLFPDIIQEKIIADLDNLLSQSKLDGVTIKFTEPQVKAVNADKKQGNGAAKNDEQKLLDQYNQGQKSTVKDVLTDDKKKASNLVAENMTVSIDFKGSYSNLISFIDKVQNFNKKIVINNLNITSDSSSGISGSISLDFYAVPKLEEDKDYSKWDYNNKYGKDNPFASNSSGATDGTSAASTQPNYDFLMSVKPISSDLPTVILGKAKDESTETYVYGDNAGIENVQIHFTEANGKYYYSYSTSRGKYPNQAGNSGVEFKPSNAISIEIYGTARNSASDVSGANVKIYNDTNLPVNTFITGDDKDRPRVNVTGESGSVTIKRG